MKKKLLIIIALCVATVAFADDTEDPDTIILSRSKIEGYETSRFVGRWEQASCFYVGGKYLLETVVLYPEDQEYGDLSIYTFFEDGRGTLADYEGDTHETPFVWRGWKGTLTIGFAARVDRYDILFLDDNNLAFLNMTSDKDDGVVIITGIFRRMTDE